MNEDKIIKCPHCNEELTHLEYASDVREYGNCDVFVFTDTITHRDIAETECFESNDSESIGATTEYTCPNCGEEILLRNLIIENPTPPTPAPSQEPPQELDTALDEGAIKTSIINNAANIRTTTPLNTSVVGCICENCGKFINVDTHKISTIDCPNCDYEINITNFKIKMNSGEFKIKNEQRKTKKRISV